MIKHYLKMIWNRRGKNAFLIAEIFLAFLATFAVLSFVITQLQKYKVPLGFESENRYVAQLSVDALQEDSVAFFEIKEQLKREVNAMDGVRMSSYSNSVIPFGFSTWSTGDRDEDTGFEFFVEYIMGDIDYADVWGFEIVEGRFYNEEDLLKERKPIVINRKAQSKFLKDTTTLGMHLNFGGSEVEIIGLVENSKYKGDFMEEEPFALFPVEAAWEQITALSILTDPTVGPSFEKELSDIIARITKNHDFALEKAHQSRKMKAKSSWIPIVALLSLAGFLMINIAMGLFGVLRYNISKRKPEIGLRKAMGASPAKINRQFIGEMTILATLALVVGTIFAAQVPLLNIFEGESKVYWMSIVYALVIIYAIVFLCSLIPSSQAGKIDPALALHEE